MSETSTPRQIRRATRDTSASILGGVAAGLAEHLAAPVLWVRAGFVVLTALGGLGVALYAALWASLPSRDRFEVSTPGAESASRGGRRPGPIRRLTDAGPAFALAALGIGVIFVVEVTFGISQVFWPLLLAGGGIALIWRQADEAQRERWLNSAGRIDPLRALFGQGWQSWLRVGAGLLLLLLAAAYVAALNATLVGLLITSGLVLAAIAIVVGPLLARLARDLSAERDERIRTQERADVAAHLHDSVLQTLALIQKNSADPAAVSRLARAQERDLRSWLYADESVVPDTLAGALRGAAAEIEDAHGIAVDVVAVGDGPFSEEVRPLVAATREALTNAAKHAGVAQVSVYAEVTPGQAEVFVRDRGVGFDVDGVAEDRHGVAGSIIDRMRRHGGSASVTSTPGEGTNVHLAMPLKETTHD
ncbi:ATP-binding protein [Nocardioides sp. Kera G14]|uniref:ATP-binding protein n=1 Tax=Nocardioides sp. Kera G14 TaxID=2884264 RepID=UPI001D129CFF|nr:ATP-binding protein [Nocardioides sp. Kera G14]UDY24363.1 PspC domain-containing protein [Nocardioides sp. Kera G14]